MFVIAATGRLTADSRPLRLSNTGLRPVLEARPTYGLNSRTISTQAFTFSTGVSGRMP